MRRVLAWASVAVLLAGCGGKEPGSTKLTSGVIGLGCDEAVLPVMQKQVEEFRSQYPDAQIELRPGEAREVVAAFANDSIRFMTLGRALSKDEREALAAAKVQYQEYEVARTAIIVVTHRGVPATKLRLGELDTLFTGRQIRWPSPGRLMVELAVGGINASVTEVFRERVLGGGGYDPAAKSFSSSKELMDYVSSTPGAIGIAGLNWLKGNEDRVNIVPLASSAMRPDSTYAPGEYYAPAQAYVYLGYYPLTSPVYMYSREVNRDLGLGFISFVSSAAGQKVFQNSGLVPATMPVRLVQLSSQQVH